MVEKHLDTDYFPPVVRYVVLLLLVFGALYIRAFHIVDPPLDFAPNCQYRSAMIARDMYFRDNPAIPEWRRDLARSQKGSLYEPPLMEFLAATAYRIAGKEILWFPGLLSSLFWLLGGWFVFLIVCRLFSSDAALVSTAYFLFVPFGIRASRSFQPDPLMILGTLAGLYVILQYYDKPTRLRFYLAAVLLAVVILIKFINVFVLLGAFYFLGLQKDGIRRTFRNVHNYIFGLICLLPSFAYYSYVVLVTKTLPSSYFYPYLYFKKFFWMDWLTLATRVVGSAPLFLAVLGFFLIRRTETRYFAAGLWLGYVIYGLVFIYSTYTHGYYHLQLIPVVAIILGAFFQPIFERLNSTGRILPLKLAVIVLLFVPVLFSIRAARWRFDNPRYRMMAETAREIGETIKHSIKTIYLSENYGAWLKYHGEIGGVFWPTHWDIKSEKVKGFPSPPAEKRFDQFISQYDVDYFIVTFFEEFAKQTALSRLLNERFSVLRQSDKYLIFDLRNEKSNH